ncbi:MAG: lysine--tRNA ligase [Lentisphaerae bacterium]|nr:lysine--tRNA ligase [Lentisphaerota bacterium]
MSGAEENEYREHRLANMARLIELGYEPFGNAFARSGRLADVRAKYNEDEHVSIAGRLMTVRDMGKSIFADVRDGSDRLQIYIQKKKLGDAAFAAFKLLDMGDHIGVEGTLFTTKTGEKTVFAEKWVLLAKALLPLPEKWHGLRDVEARYRQRYLDLIANPEVRDLFDKRIKVVSEIRSYLTERGFQEVETPMMQPQAGGAAAQPFVTRYSALNTDMYLRIAPELYLKRLLVGGFDKVFEMNRNFRNEGLSRTHNPEFTMLEIYEAYSNVTGMQKLIQSLIVHVAETVFGGLHVGNGDASLDLTPPWREVTYRELIVERMGADWYELSRDDAAARAESENLSIDRQWDMLMITHEIYEKLIERTLMQPTFVTRLPAELVPLARICKDDPSSVDVFELVIAGQEVAPAYTEMNDPIEQRRRFEAQAAHGGGSLDEDFLTALEHGMPPAGGMGVGIDRLVMILSGADAIRDVILFPQLRPRSSSGAN